MGWQQAWSQSFLHDSVLCFSYEKAKCYESFESEFSGGGGGGGGGARFQSFSFESIPMPALGTVPLGLTLVIVLQGLWGTDTGDSALGMLGDWFILPLWGTHTHPRTMTNSRTLPSLVSANPNHTTYPNPYLTALHIVYMLHCDMCVCFVFQLWRGLHRGVLSRWQPLQQLVHEPWNLPNSRPRHFTQSRMHLSHR